MAGETCRRDCQNMDKHKRYSNYIAGGRGEGMHRKKMIVIYAYIHRSDSSLLRASQKNCIKDHWITGSRIKDQGSRIKDQGSRIKMIQINGIN